VEGEEPLESRRAVRLTIGVTAHRDLLAEQAPAIRVLLRSFFLDLQRQFPATPLQALCPLAEGGDRLFAQVAVELGIPLVVPLPLPREQYARDFADAASREEFAALIRGATVLELPMAAGVSLPQVSRDGAARDHAYARLGVFVSSHSQILVALWDGRRSGLVGGTDQIVRYRLYNLYPDHSGVHLPGPTVIADDENDLTFHIRCARGQSGGRASPGRVTAMWLTGSTDHPRTDVMPERYVTIFSTTGDYNREAARLGPDRCDTIGLLRGEECRACPPAVRRIDHAFAIADTLANRYQRRLNFALRGTYLIAILMGGVYVCYSTLPRQHVLLYAFLGLFVAGYLLYERARRRQWHRRYLDYRVLAEGLRVQFYWGLAGVDNGDGRFALESFLQKQDPDLGWIRHVMRDVALRAGILPDTGTEGLEFTVRHWIGDPGDFEGPGQVNYYRCKAAQRLHLHRLTERLGTACLWSGMAVAATLAAAGTQLPPPAHTVLLLLLGLLPLVAAVRAAYSHKRADKELIKQYRFMEHAFQNAHRRLTVTANPAEKREVLRLLGAAALDEHAEWILTHRERPPEHSKL